MKMKAALTKKAKIRFVFGEIQHIHLIYHDALMQDLGPTVIISLKSRILIYKVCFSVISLDLLVTCLT